MRLQPFHHRRLLLGRPFQSFFSLTRLAFIGFGANQILLQGAALLLAVFVETVGVLLGRFASDDSLTIPIGP